MTEFERLRRIAEALPDGALVTLPRDFLIEATADTGRLTDRDLTVADAAAHFKRSQSSVRSWISSGALRAFKRRGRQWLIPTSAIAEFEAAERDGVPDRHDRRAVSADLSAWRRAS